MPINQIDEGFPHNWRAEILAARPLILPRRAFTYPREAEEVERGAMEVLVRSDSFAMQHSPSAQESLDAQSSPGAESFLATCALGFRDPAAPTGVWSTPHPDWLCAVSGGYAYLINTTEPTEFVMIELRPVLVVHTVPNQELLLFVGHTSIVAWGIAGEAWHSDKLSDEGITVERIEGGILHGRGWRIQTDREFSFELDLKTGHLR